MRGIIDWLVGTFAIGAAAMLIIGVLFLVWGAVWEVWNENASHDHPGLYAERACSACSCGLVEVAAVATPTPTETLPVCQITPGGPEVTVEPTDTHTSPTEQPTNLPTDTPPPGPTATPEPTDLPKPTPTVEPTDVPEPTRTPKPKCNRGLGNGAEGCDPGNSGGQPGGAGEDNEPDGPPGQGKK